MHENPESAVFERCEGKVSVVGFDDAVRDGEAEADAGVVGVYALVATLAEPFQRGSNRVRTDHAGVGLGLAIVESIARAHDGTLTLTPRPAGGLSVTVQFPAAPAQRSPD